MTLTGLVNVLARGEKSNNYKSSRHILVNNREVAVQSKVESSQQSRIRHHLGVSQTFKEKYVTDLFDNEDSEEEDQKLSSEKKRRMVKKLAASTLNHGQKRAPGLRKISRQLINTIRASKDALTYREVSDIMTEANYESIVDEVINQSKFESDMSSSNKMDRQMNMSSTGSTSTRESSKLEKETLRAVANYQRRIYDAWSVLNAAQIIMKTGGSKQYKYNKDVLEAKDRMEDSSQYSVNADKMRELMDMLKEIEPRQQH